MNLKIQLLARILIVAAICLSSGAYYVLYQTNQQAMLEAERTALRIEKQMKTQLLQMFKRNDFSSPFPDINLWQQIKSIPGSCTQFLSLTQSRQRSLCNDTSELDPEWPQWFGEVYQQFFNPSFEVRRRVHFNAIHYGTLLVSLNVQTEIARAWSTLSAVIGLMFVTIIAFSALMFVTISRMLQPAQAIVSGLKQMQQGSLNIRLPEFEVTEWKQTSSAINDLASSQQKVLAENQQLALKLINAQEEEHRYISRELHDEFGQCLAGINAMTTSIQQSATNTCPDVIEDAKSISNITQHMMSALRNLLTRLRPAEVDDMGLVASLHKLIRSWNQHSAQETVYEFKMDDALNDLPEPLPVNIYRIVQECLTNIAKHASAKNASVIINSQNNHSLNIIIEDDGIAEAGSFDTQRGVGLLGINERVNALGGTITVKAKEQGGFYMAVNIPMSNQVEIKK
jgi:signal transduction histidine kinase